MPLTKERLREEPRSNLEQVAHALGFWSGFERWSDRVLVRRVWRQLRPGRKRVVKEEHVYRARRIDLDRLARWLKIEVVEGFDDAELAWLVWRRVDARAETQVSAK
jgi:hypothetical protein